MKRIFMTIPGFAPHGGIRVILEWANRLAANHRVYLRSLKKGRCDWFDIDSRVKVIWEDSVLPYVDLLIVTSPHAAEYLRAPKPVRKVIFLQMLEHYFCPHNSIWRAKCQALYQSPLPLISISEWNIREMREEFGRTGPTHYIGNGINLDHFPLSTKPKDGKTVLVEGWHPGNPSKDRERLGAQVATILRRAGFRIVAFSQIMMPNDPYSKVPHEYLVSPSLEDLNRIYEEATILLKATVMDARSCSPMEAMTKGTVTARAIQFGDDDLIHGMNCLRSGYRFGELLHHAKRLLEEERLRSDLSKACLHYASTFTWEYWWPIIESILWDKQNDEAPSRSENRPLSSGDGPNP